MKNKNTHASKKYLKVANNLQKSGKLDKAIEAYKLSIALDSSLVESYSNLGKLLADQGLVDQAISYYRKAVQISPYNWQLCFDLGKILDLQKLWDEAEAYYRKAIELQPNRFQAYLKLGDLLIEPHQLEEQIALYSKAIELQPEHPQAHRKLAQAIVKNKGKLEALAKMGQLSETIAFYRKLASLPSFLVYDTAHSEIVHSNLGKLIFQQSIYCGNFSSAVTFFQEVSESQPGNSWYFYYLGKCREAKNEIDKALNCYCKAIEIRANFAEAYIRIGEIYTQKRDWDKAFDNYVNALQISPTDQLLHKKIHVYFKKLKINLLFEKIKPKVEAYQKALNGKKLYSVNLTIQARILHESGLTEEAIQLNKKNCFNIIKKVNPEYISKSWDTDNLSGPNFLIIGVQKCGTSSLYDYLGYHPQVLPSILKEHNKNGLSQDHQILKKNINYYLSLFPPLSSSEEYITGEASPSYFYSLNSHQNILSYFPKIKLIAILRNPVKRLISQYFFLIRRDKIRNKSLQEIMESEIEVLTEYENIDRIINQGVTAQHLVIHGLYLYFLEKWMNIFPREQFLIVRNEDLGKNPAAVMSQVFDFLEVPDYPDIEYARKNTTNYPSQIDESLLTRLQDFYQPHNQRLEEFLGRKFNWD